MRTPQQASENYGNGTSNRANFWEERAKNANWQAGAGSDSAESNFKTAMQDVIAKGTRKNGVMQTPNSVYQAGIIASSGRYAQGTAAALNKMQAFFNKLLPDIQSNVAAMPQRGPRGSQVNIMQRGTQLQTKLAANRGKYKVRGVAKSTGGA